ncbi:hypothetical protein ABD71_02870 [Brevibacillus laterosporus]|nr:hypothetical protein [Brevibacillus laterosporus]
MVRRSKNKNPTKSRKKTWIKIGIKCWTFLKGEIGTLVVRTRTRVLGRSAYPLSTTYSSNLWMLRNAGQTRGGIRSLNALVCDGCSGELIDYRFV